MKNKSATRLICIAIASISLLACSDGSEKQVSELRAGYENPPQEARPQVWWHWMNGNVTKDGIKKDLEWMKRIGLGGFHHFDAAMSTPQVVDKRLIYMDDGWKDAFAYAAHLADSLGLQMTVASAPGWSATGGPWVEPKDAMKKLVWRTAVIEGGKDVEVTLPELFKSTGAFQNASAEGRGSASVAEYSEDIAVIAVKLPANDRIMQEMGAKISSSSGTFSLDELTDDDLMNGGTLSAQPGKNAWILIEFPKAETIKTVSVSDGRGSNFPGGGPGGPAGQWLECSQNGVNFTKVCDLVGSGTLRSVDIPETSARFFRVVYHISDQPSRPNFMGMGGGMPAPTSVHVSELVLYGSSRVARSYDKAGFTATGALLNSPSRGSIEAFAKAEDTMDLTDKVDSDGVLRWSAPEGRWKVYRFGFSLTGKQNHPAPPEATGLEVDKLDPVAWSKYFHTYFDMYKDAADGLIGKNGVQYVLTDSYEAEQENWTPAMFEEFLSRRGYDLKAWLPVLTGQVIGSPEQSDAFLYDWRKTIGELIYENYEHLSDIARNDYGMLGRYSEAHEAGRVYPVDGMDVKKLAEVPMSAMWVCAPWLGRTADGDIDRSPYIADCQESASVAHVYGQNVAAAESLTAWGNVQYSYSPANLKPVVDLELAMGINRLVVHESAHQPSDEYVPGYSLGGIGQWFNRHDSWAEQAGAWVDYIAKSSYMLQAGKNVADVLVYYGEDANVTNLFGGRQPILPFGTNFDYLSPNALLQQISYSKGALRSKSGTEYKVLWLERNCQVMSIDILRKISELAEAGAIICGHRPTSTVSVEDKTEEFNKLVANIWDSNRKNVFENETIDKVLQLAGVTPDINIKEYSGIRFLHRDLGKAQVYWISKPGPATRKLTVSFRVSGLKPQVWHPDTGLIEDVAYAIKDDRIEVELNLVQDDAVFVVFGGKAEQSFVPEAKKTIAENEIHGPWQVAFQARRGAPATAEFDSLQSYTESSDFGIKYFSGVADYTKTITLGNPDGTVYLDLGNVANLAEVYVNGTFCGTSWKAPYIVDITGAVREGENELRIRVVNLWVNRLIGDEQPDCPEKITFTDARHYTAQTPLLPAGLLGPVSIRIQK